MIAAVIVLSLAPGGVASPPGARAAGSARAATPACHSSGRAFRPTSISIRHVVGATRVLARGRDAYGAPVPPPLTETGKWQFSWDKTVRAGAAHGVVRLTAHTYPAFAGLALGNRLLARLHRGDTIRVSGAGHVRCYRVTRRFSVPATGSVAAYYAPSGPPRLGIIVCSGKRRGPGDWSRRTVWLAAPEDF